MIHHPVSDSERKRAEADISLGVGGTAVNTLVCPSFVSPPPLESGPAILMTPRQGAEPA